MKYDQLQNMTRGWFIGPFYPSVLHTSACEVAVKHYNKGDYDSQHFHKVATEVTLILQGSVEMNKKRLVSGEIVTVFPGEVTDFLALTQATTLVIKIPGTEQDKYEITFPVTL